MEDLKNEIIKETRYLSDTVRGIDHIDERDLQAIQNMRKILTEKMKKRQESLKIILGRDDDETVADLEWVRTFFTHMGPQHSAWENGPLVWLVRFERFTLFKEPIPHVKTRSQVRAICFALGLKID